MFEKVMVSESNETKISQTRRARDRNKILNEYVKES